MQKMLNYFNKKIYFHDEILIYFELNFLKIN